VASVSDRRFSGTQHLALGVENLTGQPGVAVISHFEFVPLRHLVRFSVRRSYLATKPGPACDKGAAQWSMMTLRYTRIGCRADGTVLTVQARRPGQLGFTPPGGVFPPNYQISVLADLRQMPGGFAIIGMRMVGADGYLDAVDSGGLWYIYREDGKNLKLLAHGSVAPEKTYELKAAADGAEQSLAIDGVGVARVPDSPAMSTAFVLLEAGNFSAHAGSAIFRDFTFTPLR
jgi:hypothetical protein